MLSMIFLAVMRVLDEFPEVTKWAKNVSDLIKLFGFGISAGAIGVGFILLMISWGNERREAMAKSGLWCAAIGFFGLLATGLIQAVIARVAGVSWP